VCVVPSGATVVVAGKDSISNRPKLYSRRVMCGLTYSLSSLS